jgi:DNA modification methylase
MATKKARKQETKTPHEIKEVMIKDLNPAPYNPRGIEEKALSGLTKSIQAFGDLSVMVVNKRGMRVISGHQMLKAHKELGTEKVLAILVDVDEVKEKTINLQMNNRAIQGHWTDAIVPLIEQLKLSMDDEEFISLRFNDLRKEAEKLGYLNMGKGDRLPDDVPKPPKKATSKPGDIWVLGDHRLMCGDSTKEEDVLKLMDGKKAKLMDTDPPYMVDYTGKNRPQKKGQNKKKKDWSDLYHEIEITDAEGFMRGFLTQALKVLDKCSAMYIWHAFKRYSLIEKVCHELGILVHQQIIWDKPCPVASFSFYAWKHEPCILCWKKGGKPRYVAQMKNIASVWHIEYLSKDGEKMYEPINDLWPKDWEGKKRSPSVKLNHPTPKPVGLFTLPMRLSTHPGDICYEPFSGSGTHIIACEMVQRKCYAMEMEPIFVDQAVQRWEEFTGRKANLLK